MFRDLWVRVAPWIPWLGVWGCEFYACYLCYVKGRADGYAKGLDAPVINRLRGSTVELHRGAVWISAPSDRHAAEILARVSVRSTEDAS